MAERWAISSGNANATGTWDGGTLPNIDDDIYANGFTVTINVNTHWKSVNTIAGTTAVAGGGFTLSNGVTLTLNNGAGNAVAGTSTCVSFNGTAGNSATLVGHPFGSNTAGNRWGISNLNTGTLNIIGNPTAGSQSAGYGAVNNSTGIMNVTGNPTGGSNSNSIGAVNGSSGTLNIVGNCTGSTGVNGAGAQNSSSGTINVTGTLLGGSGSGAGGVRQTGSGTTNITGNATGGTASGGPGVVVTGGHCVVNGNLIASSNASGMTVSSSAVSVTVNGNVTGGGTGSTAVMGVDIQNSATVTVNGNAIGATSIATGYGVRVNSSGSGGTLILNGTCISNLAPGVFGGTSATLTAIARAETGTDKIFPYTGKVVFVSLPVAVIGIRNSAGTLGELSAGGIKNVFSPPSVFGAS